MIENDTIAAISTAQGIGAIGIVRISGSNAFDIARRVFRGNKDFDDIKSHTIAYGKIKDPNNDDTIDEVLMTKMKGPKTFTTEDVVEINCHGGSVALRRVLELLIKEGARLAEPGEFTKRAFVNGRMDLSQAEAVIDLINSKTEAGLKAALSQLEGNLSNKIRHIRGSLIELIAHIEVTVDYPEDDIEEITGNDAYSRVVQLSAEMKELVKSFERGRIIREGINVVITGRPNAGKSSLLNELSGKSKAIVTDIPGTTRDIIEEYISMNGIPVRLVDTAGIRATDDPVEKLGVEMAQKEIGAADLLILMIDCAAGPSEEDKRILEKNIQDRTIIVLNKVDLVDTRTINSYKDLYGVYNVAEMSITNGIGVDKLENTIINKFVKENIESGNEVLVTNVRHKELLQKAVESLENAGKAFKGGMPLDCMSIDIKDAAEYLGRISGESVSDDVAHEIFSRFCIGK